MKEREDLGMKTLGLTPRGVCVNLILKYHQNTLSTKQDINDCSVPKLATGWYTCEANQNSTAKKQ